MLEDSGLVRASNSFLTAPPLSIGDARIFMDARELVRRAVTKLKYVACSSRFCMVFILGFGYISLQLPIHSQQIHDSSAHKCSPQNSLRCGNSFLYILLVLPFNLFAIKLREYFGGYLKNMCTCSEFTAISISNFWKPYFVYVSDYPKKQYFIVFLLN